MNSVSGVVEFVGTKFNGSVKVGGAYYSNAKGFKNPAKKGDNVVLTLTPWEAKGKSGLNVTGVEIVADAPKAAAPKAEAPKEEKAKPLTGGRDFDAENRGKVRHGLTVALIHLVAQEMITLEKLKDVVNSLVSFVMEG